MRRLRPHLHLATPPGTNLHDLSAEILALVAESGIRSGFVTVSPRRATTALTIDENVYCLLENVRPSSVDGCSPTQALGTIAQRDCPTNEPKKTAMRTDTHSQIIIKP